MESGGAAGGGPPALLPVVFHAEYLARILPLSLVIFFFSFSSQQEHTCRPFHSHSFPNEEVSRWVALLRYCLWIHLYLVSAEDLIQNLT